jgi:hypothetical protein
VNKLCPESHPRQKGSYPQRINRLYRCSTAGLQEENTSQPAENTHVFNYYPEQDTSLIIIIKGLKISYSIIRDQVHEDNHHKE